MKKRHPPEIKEKARKLRKAGKSLIAIAKLLNISKTTLYYWFLDLPPSLFQSDPQIRRLHLARVQVLATAAIKAKRQARLENIKKKVLTELKDFPFHNTLVQKALLSFLYWAEGTKTKKSHFKFANTDPALCLFFITLLRKAIDINEKNIRICLYLHHYHNVSRTRNFWSQLLSVPKSQFEKIYIKSRKKTKRKRKNFAGICFIKYGVGGENLRQEMLYYARGIQEKLAPVAMRP